MNRRIMGLGLGVVLAASHADAQGLVNGAGVKRIGSTGVVAGVPRIGSVPGGNAVVRKNPPTFVAVNQRPPTTSGGPPVGKAFVAVDQRPPVTGGRPPVGKAFVAVDQRPPTTGGSPPVGKAFVAVDQRPPVTGGGRPPAIPFAAVDQRPPSTFGSQIPTPRPTPVPAPNPLIGGTSFANNGGFNDRPALASASFGAQTSFSARPVSGQGPANPGTIDTEEPSTIEEPPPALDATEPLAPPPAPSQQGTVVPPARVAVQAPIQTPIQTPIQRPQGAACHARRPVCSAVTTCWTHDGGCFRCLGNGVWEQVEYLPQGTETRRVSETYRDARGVRLFDAQSGGTVWIGHAVAYAKNDREGQCQYALYCHGAWE